MSRATQLAQEEAERVEAEDEPETTPEPASEPEPDDEPQGPQTPEEVEAAQAALAEENQRHADVCRSIIGAPVFSSMFVCPTCDGFAAGFTFEAPQEFPLLQGDEYERCAGCNGHGVVLTGAIEGAPGFTQTHTPCNGQGYVLKAPAPVVTLTPAQPQGQTAEYVNYLRTQGYMVVDPPQPWTPPAQPGIGA